MYSNKRNGFSVLDLLVKIIFACIFIFILIWLFNKKVPNMTPFYSNVFRENIKYMQDAGEAYFTDDKMPKEVGQEVKITLSEMFDKKLILPFVDEDGNSCNQYNSYVSVKKLDEGYELKTNLVCNKQSDYIVKLLGCHTYCKDASCAKTCSIEKITQYEYRKLVNGSKTTYSCSSGYSLDGKYCYKTVLKDSKPAESTRTVTKPAEADYSAATTVQLDTIVKTTKSYTDALKNKSYTDALKETKKTYTDALKETKKTSVDPIVTTREGTKPCTKYKTEKKCETIYKTVSYQCNCTSQVGPTGKTETVCSTCYKTVPEEKCQNVQVPYDATCPTTETVYCCPSGTTQEGSGTSIKCYKTTTTYSCPSGYTSEGSGSSLKCYKTTTTYSCPSGYKTEGSGSSLKCYKETTTYSCPSGYTKEGSGSSLKCYKYTYSCPSGYTKEGSGSSLKCYKEVKTYSCPSEANSQTGSGATLKCYKVTQGSVRYYCENGWTLNGQTCSKKVTEKSCESGYKLEGDKCNKYDTDKVKATAHTSSTSYYTYKWSEESSLSGWEKTGKTKTVDGEEVCK